MRTDEKKGEYKKGYIYSIRSFMTDKIYIGSTFSNLSKRIYLHRSQYKRWCNNNNLRCTMSREILKYGDEYIELIKEVQVKNRNELHKCEGETMRKNMNIIVNKYMAGRNKNEYYKDHKEAILEYKNEYYKEHKETIQEYNTEYYKEHKVKLLKKNKELYIKNIHSKNIK